MEKEKQKGQTKNKNCVTSTASLRVNHLENKVLLRLLRNSASKYLLFFGTFLNVDICAIGRVHFFPVVNIGSARAVLYISAISSSHTRVTCNRAKEKVWIWWHYVT
jgi:hypothetical protein